MLINSDCTFYLFNSKTGGYNRHYVQECYWFENKSGEVSQSGYIGKSNVNIILYSKAVIPKFPTKDLVVKGKCDFKFNNSNEATVSESFRRFTSAYDFKTVKLCADYFFGGLPHIELSFV